MMCDVGLYLFGSYLTSANPRDIDLLWLYDKMVVPPDVVLAMVRECEVLMAREIQIPIHHTILSSTENTEVNFSEDVGAVFVGWLSEKANKLLGKLILLRGERRI